MPINKIEMRLAQIGVIRLGRQLMSKNNKPYPAKLETFRITSPLRSVVDQVAELFGGQVKPWQNTTGPEFEVITAASEMAVWVPVQKIDPNYERWGNGYQDRLCDGDTEQLSCKKCLCLTEYGDRWWENAPAGKTCKPTTRLSLMIADLVGIGAFKLESHGMNAASELPMLADSIANAGGPIPARLVLQARQKKSFNPNARDEKERIKTKQYLVPVLFFDFFTPAQAFSGQIAAVARQAIGGGVSDQRAIGATAAQPAVPTLTVEDWIAEIKAMDTPANLDLLQTRMRQMGVGDKTVVDAWMARRNELLRPAAKAEEAEPATAGEQPATPEPPVSEVVDAVIVEDKTPSMSGAQAWQAALDIAGQRGWNRQGLADRFMARFNCDYRDDKATDEMLVQFYRELEAGEIQ